jgi:hypothetical protein
MVHDACNMNTDERLKLSLEDVLADLWHARRLVISGDWLCSATVTSDAGHVSHIIRGWRRVHTNLFLAVRTPTEKISFSRSIN